MVVVQLKSGQWLAWCCSCNPWVVRGDFSHQLEPSKRSSTEGFLPTETAETFLSCRKDGQKQTNDWWDTAVLVGEGHPASANPSRAHWRTHLTPCVSTQELTRSHFLLNWLDFACHIWLCMASWLNILDNLVAPLTASSWVVCGEQVSCLQIGWFQSVSNLLLVLPPWGSDGGHCEIFQIEVCLKTTQVLPGEVDWSSIGTSAGKRQRGSPKSQREKGQN